MISCVSLASFLIPEHKTTQSNKKEFDSLKNPNIKNDFFSNEYDFSFLEDIFVEDIEEDKLMNTMLNKDPEVGMLNDLSLFMPIQSEETVGILKVNVLNNKNKESIYIPFDKTRLNRISCAEWSHMKISICESSNAKPTVFAEAVFPAEDKISMSTIANELHYNGPLPLIGDAEKNHIQKKEKARDIFVLHNIQKQFIKKANEIGYKLDLDDKNISWQFNA